MVALVLGTSRSLTMSAFLFRFIPPSSYSIPTSDRQPPLDSFRGPIPKAVVVVLVLIIWQGCTSVKFVAAAA